MNSQLRPKHLNLLKVRLPMAGIASILHRISGAFLFLVTPWLLYILTTSLKNNSGFERAGQYFESMPTKLIMFFIIWALMHHFLAGIRYLIIDLDYGLSKKMANLSALFVTVLGVLASIGLIVGLM